MPRYSRSIAAPRFRHFFPVAPELVYRVEGMAMLELRDTPQAILNALTVGELRFDIPRDDKYRVTASVYVTFDGVPVPNEWGIVGHKIGRPLWGWSTYEYDPVQSAIIFYYPPNPNTQLNVYDMENVRSIKFEIPRHVLVQGAVPFPTPPSLSGTPTPELTKFPDHVGKNEEEILLLDPTGPDGQFLGGFRCYAEILSQCARGKVRIAPSRRAFEYMPDTVGYIGRDSFSYRVITSLGQQSDASCVQLYLGV